MINDIQHFGQHWREWGHISVCMQSTTDVIKIGEQIETLTRVLK